MLRIFNHDGVIGHAQLHKDVPCLTETRLTQRTTVHGWHTLESIKFAVFERISVCIAFKCTHTFYLQEFTALKCLVVRNVLVATLLDKLASSLTSQNHIAWIPRKLVAPWVVVRLGCDQSTCKRLKRFEITLFGTDCVDRFHRNHMVETWIKTNFVEKQQIFFLCTGVEFCHRRTRVRCSHQMLIMSQAVFGHFWMQCHWKQRNYHICTLHFFAQRFFVVW
mmetsp:Transcript_21090/g.31396  ORF Transcript_21090/g.31396 Transcript_21090/m.31396 type:complete len:221 (+) Transcript_21090:592-1254(+)